MATDPTTRVENWNAKFDTDRVKAILDTKRPKMLEHMTTKTTALVAMEGQVKQVLDGEGVSIIQYPFYLSFGREMWRLQNNQEMSGESYAIEAATLIQKWVARGLSQTVLEKIRTDVYSVPAPTP
jgi:hypothetical protein